MLRLGVKVLAQERHVEGPVQRREDAVTNGDLWNYSGRQEDVEELSNLDKKKIVEFIDEATAIMETARLPECRLIDKWMGRKGKTCK